MSCKEILDFDDTKYKIPDKYHNYDHYFNQGYKTDIDQELLKYNADFIKVIGTLI